MIWCCVGLINWWFDAWWCDRSISLWFDAAMVWSFDDLMLNSVVIRSFDDLMLDDEITWDVTVPSQWSMFQASAGWLDVYQAVVQNIGRWCHMWLVKVMLMMNDGFEGLTSSPRSFQSRRTLKAISAGRRRRCWCCVSYWKNDLEEKKKRAWGVDAISGRVVGWSHSSLERNEKLCVWCYTAGFSFLHSWRSDWLLVQALVWNSLIDSIHLTCLLTKHMCICICPRHVWFAWSLNCWFAGVQDLRGKLPWVFSRDVGYWGV